MRGTTSLGGGGSGDFSTAFPATENPISQNGIWDNGGAVGIDWQDIQTTTGKAFASNFFVDPPRYNDDLAHLKTSYRTFAANQFVQGTVFKAGGYAPTKAHEMELLLRFNISAHSAQGYEIVWGVQGYLAVVRWNGGVGSFLALYDGGLGSIPVPADGDVLRAEIIGSNITIKRNGTLIVSSPTNFASDSTYANGQPGIGFWPEPAGDAVLANLGWKDFTAGNLS